MPDAEKIERMKSKLDSLYQEVAIAEFSGKHRIEQRKHLLRLIPKGGVGAEIGVFTGLFSEVLAEICQPKKIFLVDPWDKLHGSHYPNWGGYTNNVRVPTDGAKLAVKIRSKEMSCKSKIVCDYSGEFLGSLKKGSLDWVYLDANHEESSVMNDLNSIHNVIKDDGIISGDDCWISNDMRPNGVYLAISRFCSEKKYRIVHLDAFGQWAIVKHELITARTSLGF